MKKIIYFLSIILIINACGNSKASEKQKTNKSEQKSEDELSTNIIINSNDTMKFDKKILLVPAGKKITLTLNHTGKFPKVGMGHNFVLLKADTNVSEFAEKAAMARKTDYIPEGEQQTIAYTRLLGGGESDTITFEAPKKGYYTFLCTFPGHWQLMRGKLIVK
tara:strand:- start:3307 stop:3795 length:489 start_codon:yes stop_codon:yes gene_type:complete